MSSRTSDNMINMHYTFGNTIGSWREENFIKMNVADNLVKTISDKLLRIHSEQKNASNITWKMRRIIITN